MSCCTLSPSLKTHIKPVTYKLIYVLLYNIHTVYLAHRSYIRSNKRSMILLLKGAIQKSTVPSQFFYYKIIRFRPFLFKKHINFIHEERALAEMSAKNASFLEQLPLVNTEKSSCMYTIYEYI